MTGYYGKIEQFLRFDRLKTKSELMRGRAVYMMGLAFLATQIINLFSMYLSYGGFAFDHLVSLIACSLVFVTVCGLRYTKEFRIFAAIFSWTNKVSMVLQVPYR